MQQRDRLSRLTVPQFTALCGLLVIGVGSLLLWIPWSHGQPISYWQALFTATSAVTVTGLSIIDPGHDLTGFGQLILMGLILVGGLGLMAISIYLQGFVQQGARLKRRVDSGERILDQFGVGGVGRTFWHIARVALGLMTAGALLLFLLGFAASETSLPRRLWFCLFHAASAYNNAGFALWSDSLKSMTANLPAQLVIMALIISGGLGYRVHAELWDRKNWFPLRWRRLDLQAKAVLLSSLLLILVGWLGLLLYESFNSAHVSFQDLSAVERCWSALFQSVSARTAGFQTIPLGLDHVSGGSLVLLMLLMFIGASPGGTGGGLKTSTMAILLAATASTLRRREDVVLLSRTVDTRLVVQATALVVSSLLFISAMVLMIAVGSHQEFTFLESLFTSISAFATVGFDVGILEKLNFWGQLVLMVGMFVGRLGLLLLFSALVQPFPKTTLVRYPREQLTV
ncbi:MAG: potassium transporter TrkG [Synechococcus sp. SB0665_bin_28]|nr:potassium transporter TrkG [Synechococcus sp. SB0665_bin_28]MYF19608.1 potassium transporter TrkG [Synechococcus sp. SB0677_bin_5]